MAKGVRVAPGDPLPCPLHPQRLQIFILWGRIGYVHRAVSVACARWRVSYALASLAAVAATGSVAAVARPALTSAPARAASFQRALPEASGGLDVLPFPGTPDAPPATRIDFPALAPAQLVSVRVVGSRSGPHAGTLSAQPGSRGTQFAPVRQFVAGERVSVTAALRSKAAAAAAGAPGARSLRFSFQIAAPAPVDATGSDSAGCAGPNGCTPAGFGPMAPSSRGATKPLTHTFHSAPRLHPPVVVTIGKNTD